MYNCYSVKWPHAYIIWCFSNDCAESHFPITGSQWNIAVWLLSSTYIGTVRRAVTLALYTSLETHVSYMINSHCPTAILLMRSVISGNMPRSVKPTLNIWSQLLFDVLEMIPGKVLFAISGSQWNFAVWHFPNTYIGTVRRAVTLAFYTSLETHVSYD